MEIFNQYKHINEEAIKDIMSLKDSENRPLWLNLAQIFIRNFNPYLIKSEIEKGDLRQVASLCHKFKSGCYNIGLVVFYEKLNRVEEIIIVEKQEKIEDIQEYLQYIFDNYEEAIEEVKIKSDSISF